MRRVVIFGRGGSGKSTVGRALSASTGLPLTELDQEFWRPSLLPLPPHCWIDVQRRLVEPECWILDGDLGPYDRPEVRLAVADTVIVLDLPLVVCAWRSLRRSRERTDYWRWVIRWRRDSRPQLLSAIGEYAPNALLLILRSRREVSRLLGGG